MGPSATLFLPPTRLYSYCLASSDGISHCDPLWTHKRERSDVSVMHLALKSSVSVTFRSAAMLSLGP